MTLEYDEAQHRYLVDGRPVPSVTQLVAPLGPDLDEPDDMLEGVLDAATDRGATMHTYIEHRLFGGAPEDFELPSMYLPYAEAVDLFLSEHHITPIAIETPLAASDYAGTPDLLCEFDGATALLDWKFVAQISKSKVGAQLGGYRELCFRNGVFPGALFAVQFLKTGTYRLYPVHPGVAAQAFHQCMVLHRLKTQRHPKGRIFKEMEDI